MPLADVPQTTQLQEHLAKTLPLAMQRFVLVRLIVVVAGTRVRARCQALSLGWLFCMLRHSMCEGLCLSCILLFVSFCTVRILGSMGRTSLASLTDRLAASR